MKEYIKNLTPETVISRLKQGEILTDGKKTVEFIDGFLITKLGDDWAINITISKNYDDLYFDRPAPELKLEIGKFYNTRAGQKAYVFTKNSDGKYCVVVENQLPYTVFEGGYHSEDEETHLDLISPWCDQNKEKEIAALLKEGKTYKDIMKQLRVTSNRIATVKKQSNAGNDSNKVRGEKLLSVYKDYLAKGYSYTQIAEKLGVSFYAVSNYVYRHKKDLGK